MKNKLDNNGFSNFLVISIALALLCIGGYFGYSYLQKPEATKSVSENTESKSAQVKKEITAFKPTISEKDTYFELIDSNSSKKISIKLPKNVNLDTTYLYRDEIKADTKKIRKKEEYIFLDTEFVGEKKSIYGLEFIVSKIVPQLNFYHEGCDGSGINISTYNRNAKSVVDYYKKIQSEFDNYPVIKESNVNNFKVYTIGQLPGMSKNMSTLFEIDENYSLRITNWCIVNPENKNNDAMSNVYNQVVSSVSEVK
jgi:hypothetical protein